MSDENTAAQPQAIGVLTEVSDKIKSSAPQVRERLVAGLVEKEVASRVDLLDKGLQKRLEADREVRKCSKPDVETFDANGQSQATGFTKGAADALKKARESLDKIDKALEKALAENDFSKLKELCK